jgi:phage terminase Nu1 subunit (DNA packaging protein)
MPRKQGISARDDGPFPISVGKAASLFGVSEKTVRSWIQTGLTVLKEGGKGPGRGAIVDLAEIVRWYLSEASLDVARTRLASAQADRAQMENAARRGELLEVASVESEWSDLVLAFKAKMQTLPTKLGTQLTNVGDANIIATRIRVEVNAALAELAAAGTSVDRGSPGAGAMESRAAAGPNGKRMG